MKNTSYQTTDATVSVRGKVVHSTVINLPENWKDSIDPKTITVILTPIGAHQNLIIKRADTQEITIQSNGGIPIECYYYVSAELNI
jgi:hypothetical protein